MPRSLPPRRLSLESLETRRLLTLIPNLVIDTATESGQVAEQHLTEFEVVGDSVFFAYQSTNYGEELWKADAAGNVSLVKDIHPGLGSSEIEKTTPVNDRLLFVARNDSTLPHDVSTTVWVSDGTESGTMPLHEDLSAEVNFASEMFQGLRYFMHFRGVGAELWKTDGTKSGTERIATIQNAYSGTATTWATLDGALYFSYGTELWKTDGTTVGTQRVFSGVEGEYLRDLTAASFGLFYRTSQSKIWFSDGQADAPTKLPTTGLFRSYTVNWEGLEYFFEVDGSVYFGLGPSTLTNKLWRSDGTAAGTTLAIDLASLPAKQMQFPVQLGDRLVFSGNQKTWSFDGQTITQIGDPSRDWTYYRSDGSLAYMAIGGSALWRTDGTTAGTWQVGDIPVSVPSSSIRTDWSLVDGELFFLGFVSGAGYELHRTASGDTQPQRVTRFADTPRPTVSYSNFAVADLKAFTMGFDTTGNEKELVVYDSVSDEVHVLQRNWTSPGSSSPLALGSQVFFVDGDQVWTSDGTEDGTKVFFDGDGQFIRKLAIVGQELFWSSGGQYYLSDGTVAGTRTVQYSLDGQPLPYSDFTSAPVEAGGRFWIHYQSITGNHLLMTEDWVNYQEAAPEQTVPHGFRILGLTPTPLGLFIHTEEPSNQHGLWFANSTVPTFLVDPQVPLAAFGGTAFYKGRLYFAGHDDEHGQEPWVSDGTPEGTHRLLDINSGPTWSGGGFLGLSTSGGFSFQATDELLMFLSTTESGRELWTSDGTEAGTRMVDDLVAGRSSPLIRSLNVVDDYAYFTANDRVYGDELWITDATASGTHRLTDLFPGTGGAVPHYITAVGDDLLFVADDDVVGNAIWSLPRSETLAQPATQELLVAEDAPAATQLGLVLPSNGNSAPQFSVTGGNEDGYFDIDAVTGQVRLAQTGLDFESEPEFLLQIGQSGGFADIPLRVKVLNRNEPIEMPASWTVSIPEGAPTGTNLGAIPVSNPESPQTIRFEPLDSFRDARGLQIDEASGELYVVRGKDLDFETRPTLTFVVTASDLGLPPQTGQTTVTVQVTDVNEPPTLAQALSSTELMTEGTRSFSIEPEKFFDPEGDVLEFDMQWNGGDLPQWLSYDVVSQMITATPPVGSEGEHVLEITARDGHGGLVQANKSVTILPGHPWYNYDLPMDTSGDGFVSPIDALLVINYVNSSNPADVFQGAADQPFFLDTSADNFVTSIDALLVINFLNGSSGQGEAPPAHDEVLSDPRLFSNPWLDLEDDSFPNSKKRRWQVLGLAD